jgi:D-glycero-D-manno-heptose 1,7-bisphosphate phosphatase
MSAPTLCSPEFWTGRDPRSPATPGTNRALFLDRDGVINVEKNYVHRIEDFEFVDGIFELCAEAQRLGYKLIVITNQAGIGRGYYSVADFERLTEWMVGQFAARGITIDRVYYCPYHPTEGIGEYRRESFDRKPSPGMILRAREEFGLDLTKAALLGDKNSDIEAGVAAGIGNTIQVRSANCGDPLSAGMVVPVVRAAIAWLRANQLRNTHG